MSTTFNLKKNNTNISDLVLTPADFNNGVWESDEYAIQNFERVSLTVHFEEFGVTDPNTVGSIEILPILVNVIAGNDEEIDAPDQVQNGRDGRARKVRFIHGPDVIDFDGVDDDIPGADGNAVLVVESRGDLGDAIKLRIVDRQHDGTPTNPWTTMKIDAYGVLA